MRSDRPGGIVDIAVYTRANSYLRGVRVQRMIRPLAPVVTAAAGASVMVSVLAGAAGAASRSAHAPAPGAELWARRYGGSGQLDNTAVTSVALSPSGHTVFVTGMVTGSGNAGRSAEDYGTVAYNAATGTQL
jgi:hypothetical protein